MKTTRTMTSILIAAALLFTSFSCSPSGNPVEEEQVQTEEQKPEEGKTDEGGESGENQNPEPPKSNKVSFKTITVRDYKIKAVKDGSNISVTIPHCIDLKNVVFDIPSDYDLAFEPDPTKGIDLTEPVDVKFYAEDRVTFKTYTFSATVCPKEESAVRGVYVPSPDHTSSFSSYKNICSSLDLLEELNFNCVFLCAWAATKAAWPSEVLLANSTYSTANAGNMYKNYSGGSGDMIADLISEAHKRGIKVILWFEYGFMHRWGGVDLNDPVLAKHPDWIGINSTGGHSNYNDTDFYLNAFDPAVQQFMIDFIVEAVNRYPDLDGIQGDDRLPAMPRNSGYNEVTKAQYKSETGREVPSDFQESNWVNWRRSNLNKFAVKLHDAVKKERSSCLVCFAPNKYPWADGVLFQDWPSWVKDGACELLTVQLYVTGNYEMDLESQMKLAKELGKPGILNPAMILKNGAAILSDENISDEIMANRIAGTCGESQFWFDGLKEKAPKKMFQLFYSEKVPFPEF